MEMQYSPGSTIIVGDAYAKALGYEHSVGSMGIIDSVMNALCGVFMLTGDDVGKQVDIHVEDCLVQQEEINHYAVVVNYRNGNIYYSANEELVDFTAKCIGRAHSREFRNIAYMHQVLDFCEKELHVHAETHKYDWVIHCLDDRDDEESRKYLETYEAEVACKESEQEAFQSSKQQVMSLTASLLQQHNAQKKVDKVVKEVKGVDALETLFGKPKRLVQDDDDCEMA